MSMEILSRLRTELGRLRRRRVAIPEQQSLSVQERFLKGVLGDVRTGNAEGLFNRMLQVDRQLTGSNRTYGEPGDGYYETMHDTVDRFISDYKEDQRADMIYYLLDGGVSRLVVECDGDKVIAEPTSNSTPMVKKNWRQMATQY